MHLLNKTVAGEKPYIVSHIKRGRIVDRCTKSGWKGIPNLHNGGQIDKLFKHKQQINDNSLFIPRECCRFTDYGGRIDKANLPDRCTKSGRTWTKCSSKTAIIRQSASYIIWIHGIGIVGLHSSFCSSVLCLIENLHLWSGSVRVWVCSCSLRHLIATRHHPANSDPVL